MKSLLPIPFSVESYKALVSRCFYVDKTLFIKEIWEAPGAKVKLFTRPRRFGKTLTMNMVKTFFEKTKEDNSTYFVDKLIWKEEKYRSHQGKYPVISLTLKDCVGLNFKSALSMLCRTIAKEFKRHFEEVREHIQDPDLLNQFLKYKRGQVTYAELVDSLFFLSFILRTVYKQKVIVLIDEYDAPVQSGYKNHFYDEIIVLMRGMLSSVMKTNENLQFGLLTGVLRVSEESLISGFNNVKVYSVLDQSFRSISALPRKRLMR